MKKAALIFIFLSVSFFALGQKSIHQIQNQQFAKLKHKTQTEADWNKILPFDLEKRPPQPRERYQLNKVVYGWNPYWMGTAYYDYDYQLLSDVAYFSYEVNPQTGSYDDIHYWRTTQIVDYAHADGARVHLAVTLFDDHATFFESQTSRTRLIDSLVSLVQLRNADGVNIDFELVPGSQRDNLTNFMNNLCQRFHTEIPGSQVSIALPAIDWSNTFDVATMRNFVDLFIIMGYEYHWPSADNAGPVSPKNNGTIWSPYDVTRSVIDYLEKGIPPEKLSLGLPYYGHDWPTQNSAINSPTQGTAFSPIYSQAVEQAQTHTRLWEPHSSTPYYTYLDGQQWRQCWYDDQQSLAMKYDMVNQLGIAGIGIWALGYDNGKQALWNLLKEKFSDSGNQNCTGEIFDMGGPYGNYFSDLDYTFTIAPQSADSVILTFTNFALTQDKDTLFIFDGASTQSPLLGAFTGTNSPQTLVAHSGAFTFRFKSLYFGTQSGWQAHWYCSGTDNAIAELPNPKIRLYPNPFREKIHIELPENFRKNTEIQIFDLNGKMLLSKKTNAAKNSIEFAPLNLAEGMYLLMLKSPSQIFVKKIIKTGL